MAATCPPEFDVAVLGSGPCGSVAAAELARRRLRTALAGLADSRSNVGECLPPSVRPMLERAGVWDEFLRAGHTPSVGIRSVWGSPDDADRDFALSPYRHGWHIDRARFDAMLRAAALHGRAQGIEYAAVKAAERVSQGWRVALSTASGDRFITARLIVDATGRASAFARRAGAKRCSLDHLAGVAGYFTLPREAPPAQPMLLVEAVENGWWYTAPLPGNKLIAVLMTDTDHMQREELKQPKNWLDALRQTARQQQRIDTLGAVLLGGLRTLPAESSFLDTIAGDQWLAAGDAAAAFDPLSSQGILAAIGSGLEAARTAAAWLNGDKEAPRRYAHNTRLKYAEYLAQRSLFYALEKRWPESPFWKSRHAIPATLQQPREAVYA